MAVDRRARAQSPGDLVPVLTPLASPGAIVHATALFEIVLFNVIMFTLVEVPIVGYLINPEGGTAMVTNLRDSARRNSRTIASIVAAVIGAWLIVKGLVKLI